MRHPRRPNRHHVPRKPDDWLPLGIDGFMPPNPVVTPQSQKQLVPEPPPVERVEKQDEPETLPPSLQKPETKTKNSDDIRPTSPDLR